MNELDFSVILGIGDVEIEKTELNKRNEYLVYVKSTKKGTTCHSCGKYIEDYYGVDKEQKIRHLSVFGKPSYIIIKQARYRCSCCLKKPITTQTQSWRTKGSKNTLLFEQHILLLLINSTMEDVSIKENIGYGTIEGILERHVQGEVDWKAIKSLEIIGIDEISLRKGHGHFVTIVTSRDKLTEEIQLLGILEGRKKDVVKKFSEYSQ